MCQILCTNYKLIDWVHGRTGRENICMARGQYVRTDRSEVLASWPRVEYLPIRPDLTHSISISSYDHFCSSFVKECWLSPCIFGANIVLHRPFARIVKFTVTMFAFITSVWRKQNLILTHVDFAGLHAFLVGPYALSWSYHFDAYDLVGDFFIIR